MPRAIGREIKNRLTLGENKAYYRSTGNWWQSFKNSNHFPGILIDRNGYVFFESRNEYINDPDLTVTDQSTHFNPINNRLPNHPRYICFNAIQQTIVNQIINGNINNLRNPVSSRNVNIINRNQGHVYQIKQTRNNTCQICQTRLGTENRPYSEVHHIQPLGRPHNGDDEMSNMICVCPNCHIQLDYLFIRIDADSILNQNNENHEIERRFIQWHNDRFDNL